ncbi:MAG: hypothetical protein JWP78_3605 [Mucilaginibacter sp.]|nr:hypothetical protein [Mucilaginibacter sp.]
MYAFLLLFILICIELAEDIRSTQAKEMNY